MNASVPKINGLFDMSILTLSNEEMTKLGLTSRSSSIAAHNSKAYSDPSSQMIAIPSIMKSKSYTIVVFGLWET